MNDRAGALVVVLRYAALVVGCCCLLLAAICILMASRVYIETGGLAQSYAMVALLSGAFGLLALVLARIRR